MRVLVISWLLTILLAPVGKAVDPERTDKNGGKSPPPHILIFMVDDMGWQDTSVPFAKAVTPFNRRYRTPHMERLAKESVKFTHAYASAPVCTPTRASLMTGMSPGQNQITFWTLYKDRDTSKAHPRLLPPRWNMNGLSDSSITLAGCLREGGYRTIHIGKAHWGAHDTPGSDPTNLGFDVNVAGHGSGGPGSYYGSHHFAGDRREGGPSKKTIWDIPDLESYHGQDIYLTEALTQEAVREIEIALEQEQPFFLHFAPYAVHAPLMPNPRWLPTYEALDEREAAYATMVESMDFALGELLDCLEENGALDSTYIFFTSDNGGLSAHARGGEPHTHNAPLRSGKGSAYEGGIRVPTLIRTPDGKGEGRECSVPVITHDLYPTVLSIASLECPATLKPKMEGKNLRCLLVGEDEEFEIQRPLFWHQPHMWGAKGPGIEPFTAVRQGEWKLIYFHDGGRFELYSLRDDQGETQDRSEEFPERVSSLAKTMTEWILERSVQLSIDKATQSPVPLPSDAWENR